MKMIILAAGQGTRLRPLTDKKPKCMVEYNNKAIIDYILDTAKQCNIKDIAIVNGYKKDILQNHLKNEQIKYFTNTDYESTNMLYSLFCAKEYMNDDIIISYSDIIYKKDVLQKLINSKEDFSVIIDKKWKELWLQRMENPLEDAETLKIKNGIITEIGKKPLLYDEIQGQYIGLFKISKEKIKEIINFYEFLDKQSVYDGKDFYNMYITSFIQLIIDKSLKVKPIYINGGWLEIDCIKDLNTKII